MKKLQWDLNLNLADNARVQLPAMAAELFAEGRKAARPSASAGSLHRFRLSVKAMRYTLELFRPLYGPGLEARLKKLRRLQDILGAISDYQSTLEIVEDKLPRNSQLRSNLARMLQERIRRKRSEFRRCWSEEFDAEGEEARWRRYLARPRKMAEPAA